MEVTAWNNGKHHTTGAGYGFKISAKDRDEYFQRSWKNVLVFLPDSEQCVAVNIEKSSFWNATCLELISREFGRWLIQYGYAPWSWGAPPKFRLIPINSNSFRLYKK